MLSNDLNTLLSGRSLNIHLDTFSFTEFLDYKEIDYSSELLQIKNKIDIARAKDEYIKWGGFYEVFEVGDEIVKKEILISYAKNIIYQDIIPRYNIRNSEVVERLFFYLLSNITGTLNYTSLAKIFEINDKTIKEYINYFEDVFLLKRLDKFHNKPKERIKSSKKIYVLDNGFLQTTGKFSKDNGIALENVVFSILNKNNTQISYLKEIYEIDFKTTDTLYQVSYNMKGEKTRDRELRAFEYLDKEQKMYHKVVTYDETTQEKNIQIIQFEDFAFG
jgi:predicted AAA+ superfamily ATPase